MTVRMTHVALLFAFVAAAVVGPPCPPETAKNSDVFPRFSEKHLWTVLPDAPQCPPLGPEFARDRPSCPCCPPR